LNAVSVEAFFVMSGLVITKSIIKSMRRWANLNELLLTCINIWMLPVEPSAWWSFTLNATCGWHLL
jgi:hypothetical protein